MSEIFGVSDTAAIVSDGDFPELNDAVRAVWDANADLWNAAWATATTSICNLSRRRRSGCSQFSAAKPFSTSPAVTLSSRVV